MISERDHGGGSEVQHMDHNPTVPPKAVILTLCVCVCFVLTTQLDSIVDVNL